MILTNIKGLYGLWENHIERVYGKDMSEPPHLENCYLRIEDGVVVEYGSMDYFHYNHSDMDCSGRYVLPAFCDSHTHLVYSAPRDTEWEDRLSGLSYEEIARRGGGILNSSDSLRSATENELYNSSMQRLETIQSYGTGAVEIKSGYGLSLESEIKMLRVIARLKESSPLTIKSTLLAAHAVGREYTGRQSEYVQHIIDDIIPAVAAEGLADYIDSFCDKGFFTVEETEAMLKAASKYGIWGKIHANELAPSGGVELGSRMGCLSVDHLEEMNESAFGALEEYKHRTMPTALPAASLFLGIPYTPLREMIDRGLAVALASDYNPGSAPSGNMQLVGTLACTGAKITPMEALTASTINSAAAMGLWGGSGAIRLGCKANIIITKPMPSLSYMYYSFGENSVEKTILNK
ncbi:MAG: imidazolonepropionase [Rikenellaceae bacterium]